jgi:hypothetical protein
MSTRYSLTQLLRVPGRLSYIGVMQIRYQRCGKRWSPEQSTEAIHYSKNIIDYIYTTTINDGHREELSSL